MKNSDISIISHQSIFDGIRKEDGQGNEYWLARELQSILGYTKWQNFVLTIEKAKTSCKNTGNVVTEHFLLISVKIQKSAGRPQEDYKLSRLACYLTAMNGDPTKPEIASAQAYFAVKTREAEVVVPALNEELELARLQLEKLKLELKLREIDNSMIVMHGAPVVLALRGQVDQIVEVKQPTIEVIDQKTGAKFEGMTLVQIARYVKDKHGIAFKSGAKLGQFLESEGLGHLIAQTPRRVLADYVPEEHVSEVVKAILSGDRQLMLGE